MLSMNVASFLYLFINNSENQNMGRWGAITWHILMFVALSLGRFHGILPFAVCVLLPATLGLAIWRSFFAPSDFRFPAAIDGVRLLLPTCLIVLGSASLVRDINTTSSSALAKGPRAPGPAGS